MPTRCGPTRLISTPRSPSIPFSRAQTPLRSIDVGGVSTASRLQAQMWMCARVSNSIERRRNEHPAAEACRLHHDMITS
jgi:hypothetical protein